MATRKGRRRRGGRRGQTLSLKDLDPLDDYEDAGTHEGGGRRGQKAKGAVLYVADVSKAFLARRQHVDTFAKIIKSSSGGKQHRSKVDDDDNSQLNTVLNQWDTDTNKAKEQTDKLMSMFQQQKKLMQQMRVSQHQRLNTLKQLLEHQNQSMYQKQQQLMQQISQQVSQRQRLKKRLEQFTQALEARLTMANRRRYRVSYASGYASKESPQ